MKQGSVSQVTTVDGFTSRVDDTTGVALDTLAPGTQLLVRTRNSTYRLLVLDDPSSVLVTGGGLFRDGAVVRLEGSTGGGSLLKMGWIVVGLQLEMRIGAVRITTSRIRSVSIEHAPPNENRDCGATTYWLRDAELVRRSASSSSPNEEPNSSPVRKSTSP